jgi:serine/threonine protein kinase
MFELTEGEPRPPSVLGGKYRLEREVGRGGMGVVYLATHVALRQSYAIKVVLPALAANPVVIQRVLREARCAAQITGDHVVRVIDVGQLDSGEPFIVMEYVEGQDLARVLAEGGRLPPHVAVHWLLEASVAIAEAHQKGIVHRDLKPANLFLARTADGRELIKVIDFGISKQLGVSTELPVTRANDVMGSPNYMAPEQIRTPLLVDARADLWALGAILLELLTGHRAFPGDTITAVYTRVLEGEPELPEALAAELAAELRAIVLRCLRKDPNERFQTIHELAYALGPFAPARSGLAREAIARLQPGTLAESARVQRSASTASLGSPFEPIGASSRPATRTALRARSVIVPGVLLGLTLSAAGAALLADPEGVLDRLTSGGAGRAATRSPTAASPATVSPAAVSPAAVSLATVPPVDASDIAAPPVAAAPLPAQVESTPVGVAQPVDDVSTPDRSGATGPEAVVPRAGVPGGAVPGDAVPGDAVPGDAATLTAARESGPSKLDADDSRRDHPENAELRDRTEPAVVTPIAPRRNPWDVSTFGGRS